MDILSIRGLDSIYLSKSEIRIFEFAYFFLFNYFYAL